MSDTTTTADSASEPAHDGHAHDEKHHHADSHYTRIFVVLMVLAALSAIGPEIGSRLSLPLLTLVTAFGIAFVKAWLVMKHFMHLDVEKPIVHYFLITSVVFMVLLFAGVSPDVSNHEGKNWENLAAKEYIAKTLEEQKARLEEQKEMGEHGGAHHGEAHGDDHANEGGH